MEEGKKKGFKKERIEGQKEKKEEERKEKRGKMPITQDSMPFPQIIHILILIHIFILIHILIR